MGSAAAAHSLRIWPVVHVGMSTAGEAPAVAPGATPAGEPKICPVCRRGFAASDTRCPTHGEVLIAYSAFAKGSSGARTKAR